MSKVPQLLNRRSFVTNMVNELVVKNSIVFSCNVIYWMTWSCYLYPVLLPEWNNKRKQYDFIDILIVLGQVKFVILTKPEVRSFDRPLNYWYKLIKHSPWCKTVRTPIDQGECMFELIDKTRPERQTFRSAGQRISQTFA